MSANSRADDATIQTTSFPGGFYIEHVSRGRKPPSLGLDADLRKYFDRTRPHPTATARLVRDRYLCGLRNARGNPCKGHLGWDGDPTGYPWDDVANARTMRADYHEVMSGDAAGRWSADSACCPNRDGHASPRTGHRVPELRAATVPNAGRVRWERRLLVICPLCHGHNLID
ncbi:MAG: hypothetical protein ACKVT1_14975 [Dehalococcoidia bacterium]